MFRTDVFTPSRFTSEGCIEVYGKKGSWKGEIYMLGRDKDHMVENITLENVKYFGEKITKDSPCVNIVPDFTKNIVIK